jgi:hypothetical protein
MFYVAQVNIGTNIGINIASFLGILQIIFCLFYLIFGIIQLIRTRNRLSSSAIIFYCIQLVVIPAFLLLSGSILIFQGWRLDPILQLQQFILFLLIVFLIIKEMVINTVRRNR